MDSVVPKHCRAGSIQLRQKICKTEKRPYQHLCWHGRKSFKACFTLPLSKAKHLFRMSRVSVSRSLHIARVSGHRCAAQRPDCAPSGHPLGGRSGHREMAPGSRFPILQVADLGLIRTVKCFVARFKMALAETSSFRIIALQLFGSR